MSKFVRATVEVKLRVNVSIAWTPETTVAQVREEALGDARSVVERVIKESGRTFITVCGGEPWVVCMTVGEPST